MNKFLAITAATLSLAAVGYGFAAAMAADAPLQSWGAPVFPAQKAASQSVAQPAPQGAQYRVRSGKSGFRFVACNESRLVAGSHEEKHCLSFSPRNGWGKSMRWIPAYQLLPLTGQLPE